MAPAPGSHRKRPHQNLGIEIRAVHEGVVNTVLVGLRGLVGRLYREDSAHKVRRGLAGRVGQGFNAGGSAYGYVPVLGDKGKRVIVEAEAEIVRRIFDEYVAGRTPREIAHDLNHEGVLPPRGRSWNASTINGNMQRGTGIIQNELYAGRLVWNKVRMVKDPDTGKRLSRPNPKNDWQTADVRRGSAALSLSTHNLPLAIRRAFGQTWAVGPLRAKSSRSAISGLTGRVTDAVFCRKPGCMRMEGALARPGGKSDSSSLNQPVR